MTAEHSARAHATLSYAAPGLANIRVGLFRAAVFCWALPLFSGTVVFIAWLATRATWLQRAGLLTIVLGTLLFVGGVVSLGMFYQGLCRAAPDLARTWSKRCRVLALLLIANFPIAIGITIAAVAEETKYTVVVRNTGSVPVDRFVLSGPVFQRDLGPIAPGGSVRHAFYVAGDGQLTFTAVQGGTTFGGTIDGYVTNGVGGDKEVTIQNGTSTVKSTRR